jgi:endonuclease G
MCKFNYLYSIFFTIISINFANAQSFNFLPKVSDNQLIKHTYFTLSYSEKDEQAEWVAYMTCRKRMGGIIKRSDKFVSDPSVLTQSAKPEDYRKSGYDRGHLAPAADMKFDEIAMKECFYMSNMSPQSPSFNRGIWRILEEKIRNWAIQFDTLYIVTGGVLKSIETKIGYNKVSVPNYYYKIILKYNYKEQKAIAFIMPNQKGEQPIFNYAVTIDKIEEMTGIDFFPELPDKIEKKLESQLNIDFWK